MLVRVEAAGVCHSDPSVIDASRPRPVPMALGHEAVGIVVEVGNGVGDISVGDHVVLTFVPSCGICAECNSGSPTFCSGVAVANGEGRTLSGGSRLHDGGTDIHHQLGVSAFSQYAVVDRGSTVVIDDDIPMEVGAMLGCGVLTGVGSRSSDSTPARVR
ncbi:MAG: alcohol dehydrogenase catalytic domain-containing protein [Actinobacteria bacterium]|nr:alcohol dehydrogenase catalytic domain-containing protein [Actinomycetota bacterium]MBT3687190.1 alcohol dehydrogenase catalytic domain-containing protein [Actinomycetota bacterium]MBT4037925.1 alcohol dehydrogenase catalytic domain-containing protein [Actinomycetota bacterium]MBT4279902.1 alcohol dehydrogenase catalytic domain-containing protein [Actinomycetota bacterium]MBT4342776.1 alcohol dehydrogenase catalytic domain-containing protein [Actinomycetota bacterium]